MVTLANGSTTIEPVAGLRNSARLPTYARLDMKTGRSFMTSKGNVRVELSIVNLTDRKNACCVDDVYFVTGTDGSVATRTTLKYWLGITPSLQLIWAF